MGRGEESSRDGESIKMEGIEGGVEGGRERAGRGCTEGKRTMKELGGG